MKALSIKQPWAWLIVRPDLNTHEKRSMAHILGELKDVENRTWRTKFRGRFLVHASKGMTRSEYSFAWQLAKEIGVTVPPFEQLQRGGIIGSVELFDSVDSSDSPWYMGHKALLLRNPEPIEFFPLKGRLGFFDVPSLPAWELV